MKLYNSIAKSMTGTNYAIEKCPYLNYYAKRTRKIYCIHPQVNYNTITPTKLGNWTLPLT